ncbi:MAG TPA: hypothetical protein VK783_06250 [Bacteroidia bacterium]|jgi:hypothetical protein|nr:hypothetical protein [Bacteroidia bacterium]
METNKHKKTFTTRLLRALIEIGFIIFLFYSNLLMGEYIRSSNIGDKSLWWAICNIITPANFTIAVITGITGHLVFEFLRKKL